MSKKKKQNKTIFFEIATKTKRVDPSGYALAGGSSFWLDREQGASLALESISWIPAFASFIFAASLALADGFFPLSLPFSPSALSLDHQLGWIPLKF